MENFKSVVELLCSTFYSDREASRLLTMLGDIQCGDYAKTMLLSVLRITT